MTFSEALALMVSTLSASGLEQPGVAYEVLVGDENINANGSPPRIVIIPQSSHPVLGMGGQRTGLDARNLGFEQHSFTALLWDVAADQSVAGADYGAVSDMRGTFVSALRGAFGTSFVLGQGNWHDVEGGSLMKDGRTFLQSFSLALNFPDTTPTQAVVAHTLTNVGINEPGVTFTDP